MLSQLSPTSSRVNCHSLVIAPITYGYMLESLNNQDKLRWRWIKAHLEQTCLACTESFEIYALLKFTHYYVLIFFVFFFSFPNSMLDNTNEYIQFSFVIYLSIICSYFLCSSFILCVFFIYSRALHTRWRLKILYGLCIHRSALHN